MSQAHRRYARGRRGKLDNPEIIYYWQTLRSTRESHKWDTPSEDSASQSSEISTALCGLRSPRSHLTVHIDGPKCPDCEAME